MSDAESHECDVCGDEFDSERGLKIHQGRMHPDIGEEDDKADTGSEASVKASEKESLEESSAKVSEKESVEESSEVPSSEEIVGGVEFSLKQAALFMFIISLSTGFILGFASPLIFSGFDSESEEEEKFHTVDIGNISLEDRPSLGDSDAEMKVVKYTDFGCAFCAEWHGVDTSPRIDISSENIYPTFKEQYIDEGKVEFIVKDYPVPDLHPNSVRAHAAANCVYDQNEGAYWDFVDTLYETRDVWGEAGEDRTAPHFEEEADQLEGVNGEELVQCYLSTDGTQMAEERTNAVRNIGEMGTPTFIVGNSDDGFVMISGAQPIEEFQEAFEQVRESGIFSFL